MDLKDTLIFAVVSAGLLFILKEIGQKFITKKKVRTEINKEMKLNSLSYSDAKDNVFIKKIAKIMKIDKDTLKLEDKREIKQGDRVSFNSDKYGYVTGDFIGIKTAKASGYSEILFVRINDSQILQAPLEYIMVDTINIYGR